jgi:uncharacterized protein (PEP-CTERM system associated)
MPRTEGARRFRAARLAAWSVALVPGLGFAQGSVFGQGAPGLNPFAIGSNPDGRSYTLTPSIRASFTASDNFDLLPPGQERSSQAYELLPSVVGTVNSARATGAAFASVRGLYRPDATGDELAGLRTTLFSWGNLRIVDDLAGAYFRANVTDVNASAFGATSFNPSTQTQNRTQFRDLEVSPYLYGRFQGDGSWLARYSLNYTDPGAQLQSSVVQSLFATGRTDLTLNRFGWSTRAQLYSAAFQDGLDYTGSELDLLGWYRFDSTLRAGAGVGYASNELLSDPSGRTSGWGPSAAIEWAPTSRTFVRGRWADRYYGNTGALQVGHQSAQWTFGLNYARGISTGTAANLYGFNSASLFGGSGVPGSATGGTLSPVGQTLVNQNLLPLAGSTFGSGLVNSPLVFVENMVASVGWTRQLDAVLGTAFVNNRRTAIAFSGVLPADIDQHGGSLSYRRRLDSSNAVTLTGRQTRTVDNLGPARSTLTGLNLDWNHQLGPRLAVVLGGRLQRQNGEGGASSYDEAAVYVWATYRF